VTYQLLRLLEEKISYVQVEPLGDDEDGVDLIIGNLIILPRNWTKKSW